MTFHSEKKDVKLDKYSFTSNFFLKRSEIKRGRLGGGGLFKQDIVKKINKKIIGKKQTFSKIC